jgi:cyclomaltodextrinase
MIERSAISHRMFSPDAYAIKEGSFHLRLFAKKGNLKHCYLLYADRACPNTPLDLTKVEMTKEFSTLYQDIFGYELLNSFSRLDYCFELVDEDEDVYYIGSEFRSNLSLDHLGDRVIDNREEFFAYPCSRRDEILALPNWFKRATVYNIFPDSFASDKRKIMPHSSIPYGDKKIPCESHLGGTIKGIDENLDYIASLGMTCLYLNPIFAAESYHKYNTVDYQHIDPNFGSDEDFRLLVEHAHARGMRVILDGVFNHCGWNFFAFRDVMEKGKESAYLDWFYEIKFPLFDEEGKPRYRCFAYEKSMPKMNTSNPEVQAYFNAIGVRWVRDFGADGWRLDVCDEINQSFWRSFRAAVKAVKSDAVLIGEIWGNAESWLRGDLLDSAMDYDFTRDCREYFAFARIGAGEFYTRVAQLLTRYPEEAVRGQLNLLDSHDVSRFLSYCRGDRERYHQALAFLYLFPGVPSLFYGDEKLMEGIYENEYRHPMAWTDKSVLDRLLKKLIGIREKILDDQAAIQLLPYEELAGLFGMEYQGEQNVWQIFFNNTDHSIPLPQGGKEAVVERLLGAGDEKGLLAPKGFCVLLKKK